MTDLRFCVTNNGAVCCTCGHCFVLTSVFIAQRRSIVKSVGCFQWRLFVCLFVCVCQQTSKHRMMKLGGRCIVHKSRLRYNLGVGHSPWLHTPKNVALGYDVEKISAGCLVDIYTAIDSFTAAT